MSRVRQIDGFTLIELVTSIVIVAVLAAIVGPRFLGNQPFSERGYASEVSAALRAARQIAVTSSCQVRVTINASGGYTAMQRAASGNTCNPTGAWTETVELTDGNALAGTPPTGVTLTPVATLVFEPTGAVTGVVPLIVGPVTITVDPRSGFVQ